MAAQRKTARKRPYQRSLMLTEHLDDRLTKHCEAVSMNRNELVRLWIATLTPADTAGLIRRRDAAERATTRTRSESPSPE